MHEPRATETTVKKLILIGASISTAITSLKHISTKQKMSERVELGGWALDAFLPLKESTLSSSNPSRGRGLMLRPLRFKMGMLQPLRPKSGIFLPLLLKMGMLRPLQPKSGMLRPL